MLQSLRVSTLLTAIFALTSVFPLWAADIDAGLKAVDNGDYMTAYQVFKPLAEQGNVEAEHNLGVMYKVGKGVMKNFNKAAYWFEKAAKQGLAEAQFNLGYMYDMGQGVTHDASKAVYWYKKAAEQGHALAQSDLGVMYANGEGVKQDIILGYVWMNLAAAQGVNTAYKNQKVLLKEMSPAMKKNVRKVSREYFKRYVMPFQVEDKTRPHSAGAVHNHPDVQ